MSEDLKCWTIEAFGICAKVFARSRGRARYVAALSLYEASYVDRVGEAFKKLKKVRRAPEYDVLAVACGKEAVR